MGALMAAHLERAGYAVRSFDLNGAGNCASAREAARGAQVIITMLPEGRAVRAAVRAALPGMARGSVVVDMSSADPFGTRRLGAVLRKRGIELLDAPVSGSKAGARDATLAIMAGGDPGALEFVRPVLEKMGSRVFHVGPLGAGHALKSLNNYIGASGTVAAFEALLIGQAFGLDAARITEVFNASTGYNSTTQRKIPQQILTGAFASGFSTALMAKDVGIAADLARALKVKAPYLQQTRRIWREALQRLARGSDHVEMYRYLQSLSQRAGGGVPARARKSRLPRRAR
jgi:3-hydroxyisobutyrate dehydrogenase